VQVDPIKPTIKAPGSKLLKPSYGEPPSNFAFKSNLRRFRKATSTVANLEDRQGLTLVHSSAQPEPFFVTEPLKSPSVSLKMCLRRAETWTSISP